MTQLDMSFDGHLGNYAIVEEYCRYRRASGDKSITVWSWLSKFTLFIILSNIALTMFQQVTHELSSRMQTSIVNPKFSSYHLNLCKIQNHLHLVSQSCRSERSFTSIHSRILMKNRIKILRNCWFIEASRLTWNLLKKLWNHDTKSIWLTVLYKKILLSVLYVTFTLYFYFDTLFYIFLTQQRE